ncbi:TlpA family protein disulfide reductase [Paenibacillus puldeungensis]|uniref:TlpA family protein disulfide reductase n=1 Tax=Paenibacillus puldeungensis TaxID=696536 RepID=A0ABW3S0D4_9BACL
MDSLQLGPFILNGRLILYLSFGLGGWLLLLYRLRNWSRRGDIFSRLFSGLLLWLLIWKGSFILFHPSEFLSHPLSLLYFDGGVWGVGLASFVSVSFVWLRWIKQGFMHRQIIDIIVWFALGGWISSRLLLLSFGGEDRWGYALHLGLTLIILALFWVFRTLFRENKTKEMKRNIVVILALIGLVVYAGYDFYSQVDKFSTDGSTLEVGIQKGKLAPDFILTNLKGEPVKLSDYKGKKVLINFWATWCPPCQAEMPHMQKIYANYESKDVVVLGVNLSFTEKGSDSVQAFVDEQGISFPIVLDKEGNVAELYQVSAYPTTYFVDGNGVIRERLQGAISYDRMKAAVKNL